MEKYEFYFEGSANFEFHNNDQESLARFLNKALAYTKRQSLALDGYKLSIEQIMEITEGHINFHKKHGGNNYSVLEFKRTSSRFRLSGEVIVIKSFGTRSSVVITTKTMRKGKTCIKHRKGRVPVGLV